MAQVFQFEEPILNGGFHGRALAEAIVVRKVLQPV
jgi:hypothetical protein